MSEGVDYSSARPRAWVLASEGKRFAARYAGPGSTGKHMSRAEVQALVAAGLSVVTLCEGAARDALGGHARGVDHARRARDMAKDAGMPPGRPIYFAIDFDASAGELEKTVPYLDGATSVIGLSSVGIYGGWRTVDWAARNGRAAWYFQTYAWSAGKVHTRAHMLQYHNGASIDGGSVDLCRSIAADFGQWRPGVETVGEAPPSTPPPEQSEWWDYVPTIDGLRGQIDDLASALDGSARAIEASWSG
jgi:hypothetical protein